MRWYPLSTVFLEPVDVCGCGDEGYLSVRTITIDLAHGVGKLHRVPVYHCRSNACPEYTVPESVSRRLEVLAEEMEAENSLEMEFNWLEKSQEKSQENSGDRGATARPKDPLEPLVQAFTLKFIDREYEDAQVVFVLPGLAVFLQSRLDPSEFYLLRYAPETHNTGIWFSFAKFYSDQPQVEFESFLTEEPDVYLKELAVLALDEVEDSFSDEFGAICE